MPNIFSSIYTLKALVLVQGIRLCVSVIKGKHGSDKDIHQDLLSVIENRALPWGPSVKKITV